jgi:hypothetical protein
MMKDRKNQFIIKEMIIKDKIGEIKEDSNSNSQLSHGDKILKLSRKKRKILNLFKLQLNKMEKQIKLKKSKHHQIRREINNKKI